ncbi:MAG: hypothetical protein R3E44_06475 [Paracoccaceae bacterium]
MKLNRFAAAVVALVLPFAAVPGPVSDACLKSNDQANPLLCDCIQRVADLTLTASDQRLAASFFVNPLEAQQVGASQGDRDREFWQRYVNFGESAEGVCSRE